MIRNVARPPARSDGQRSLGRTDQRDGRRVTTIYRQEALLHWQRRQRSQMRRLLEIQSTERERERESDCLIIDNQSAFRDAA